MVSLLVVLVAAVVVFPLLSGRAPRERASDERLATLEARKQAKYREIRDAELDFRAGKLSEPDYETIDRELRREALAILDEIEALERDKRE